MDSAYESTLADAFVLDAGSTAETDGYDLVCSFSMSDSGVAALRSRLKIPVVGAGQASLSLAAQLGHRFSVITMWEPWRRHVIENVARYGMSEKLASVRHIDVRPDTLQLLSGKEELVFAALAAAATGQRSTAIPRSSSSTARSTKPGAAGVGSCLPLAMTAPVSMSIATSTSMSARSSISSPPAITA